MIAAIIIRQGSAMDIDSYYLTRALNTSDEDLYEDIARYVIGTEYARTLVEDGTIANELRFGLINGNDLKELGKAVFNRLSNEIFDLVCGNSTEDRDDKMAILQAAGLSDVALLAALSSLIQATLHLSVPLCAAGAGLLMRHIIRPAGSEVCVFWRTKL